MTNIPYSFVSLKLRNNGSHTNEIMDRTNDVIFTRVTKYDQNNHGDVQKWGPLQYFRWLGVTQAIKTARVLLNFNLIENGTDVITPTTDSKGESNEFYNNYQKVVEGIADLSRG